MALFITDASQKISSIRTAFPHDTVLAVDFPLFGRFTRTSKLKYDQWPKLKPLARAKIDKIVKAASTHREIFGVFDRSPYGQTLARDVQEALRGVNARVSFLFPDVMSSEVIKATRASSVNEDVDVKFIIDRYLSQKLKSLLSDVFNVSAEVELTRQQAYMLGVLHDISLQHKPFAFTDQIDRVWRSPSTKFGESSTTQMQRTYTPKPWSLACAPVSWERLWGGIERLQALGLITTSEVKMSEQIFEENCTNLERLGLQPASDPPDLKYYWVVKPSYDPNMINDELAARPLFEWLRIETLRSCCAPIEAVVLHGKHGDFSFSGPIVSSWLPLDPKIKTTMPFALEYPNKVELDQSLIPFGDLCKYCSHVLSQRESWSALMSLHRRGYVKRLRDGVWLSSRGCTAILALQQVMPIALTEELSRHALSCCEQETDDERLNMLNAIFSEYCVPSDITMWEQFLRGKPLRICSTRSASWISSMNDEQQYGIALVDGRIRPVKPSIELKLPCPCGTNIVKTMLDASFEPVLFCPSCNKEHVLTTLQSME
jgi:hypothetical protein